MVGKVYVESSGYDPERGQHPDPEPELTERQHQILEVIRIFQREHGYAPTYRELAKLLGIRSNNGVSDHLKALAAKGKITYIPRLTRSLQIVGEPPVALTREDQLVNGLRAEVARLEALGPRVVSKMVEHETDLGALARSSLLRLRALLALTKQKEVTHV